MTGLPAARQLVVALAALLLVLNLALRGHALVGAGGTLVVPIVIVTVFTVCAVWLTRPRLVSWLLQCFGASFLLYGFHSYRLPSQVLELLVSALALALLFRLARAPRAGGVGSDDLPGSAGGSGPRAGIVSLGLTYTLVATASLALLPATVLEHRLYVEGHGFVRAVLSAFPKDPLYLIASVARLWLFLLFAVLVAVQRDGRALWRALFRGVAWAAIVASALGCLDFAGILSLDAYNLSNLFYGHQYRRLQSTFGNPSWFACFVACALPFVWLDFREARGRLRVALATAFPICAAAVFLSGARAAWIAATALLAAIAAGAVFARRLGRPLLAPDRATWLALGGTLATAMALWANAWTTPLTRDASDLAAEPAGRLEGLSREMQYRGLGVQSPRRVVAQYALELARLRPVLGLGYESFSLHLRAQLEIPGTGVASVVNTARLADSTDSAFDDSHNTYLQVLTGTGAVGLVLWLALVLASLGAAYRAFRCHGSPEALAVLLGLGVFHLYGLFQGMAYIPVTFLLFPLLSGYAATLDSSRGSGALRRPRSAVLALVACAAVVGYASDSGYASLKQRFGVTAYLPDEAVDFEGFYRAETGAAGEYRWMRDRAIVNLRHVRPFRLRFTCVHPDAEGDPVVLHWSFEGRETGQIVFRRPAALEQRFAFNAPGALRLRVSRTFHPASGEDRRELGIAVSAIRWE